MMSRKETTQGCLTFMVTCRIGLTPLLNNLQSISSVTKHAVFSDNLAGAVIGEHNMLSNTTNVGKVIIPIYVV